MLLSVTVLLFSCTKNATIENYEELEETINNETFVPILQAIDVAATFLGTLSDDPETKSKSRLVTTETIRDDKNYEPLMYIMNYDGGGFTIVSATKSYYPILAYSEDNPFEMKEDMDNMVVWLDITKESIKQSAGLEDNIKEEIRTLWSSLESSNSSSVTPVKTKSPNPEEYAFQNRTEALWSSVPDPEAYTIHRLSEMSGEIPAGLYSELCDLADYYYSPRDYTIVGIKHEYSFSQVGPLLSTIWHQDVPFNDLINGLAGCGTIAVAQIMKFHEYPEDYNWSNIPNMSVTLDTKELIRDVHSYLGSAAMPNDAKNAFLSFGFNASLSDHNAVDVRNEIINYQRPVSMGGYTKAPIMGMPMGDGHRWICDGVQDSRYFASYFIEFRSGSSGSYNYSSLNYPSIQSPELFNTQITYFYYMKWGWFGGDNNGWFLNSSVNTLGGNYQYYRKNIYVSK